MNPVPVHMLIVSGHRLETVVIADPALPKQIWGTLRGADLWFPGATDEELDRLRLFLWEDENGSAVYRELWEFRFRMGQGDHASFECILCRRIVPGRILDRLSPAERPYLHGKTCAWSRRSEIQSEMQRLLEAWKETGRLVAPEDCEAKEGQ